MSAAPSLRLEILQLPREPRGIHSEEGRKRLARMLAFGAEGDIEYTPEQIAQRIELFLCRYAANVERGKYGR